MQYCGLWQQLEDMTVVLSIADLLSRRKDFARRCAWNTILQTWFQDYPFTWLSRAHSVSLSLCTCIFFGLAETAEFIFESTAFNSLFFFSEQRRVTQEVRCLSCSSFIMCYNTVKPLFLLTPLYNKQFFCKDTYVTNSVRIIQLSSLYKCSNYRGVRIIEASFS